MSTPQLKVYKLHEDVVLPSFGTTESACFDLRAHLAVTPVTFYSNRNVKYEILPSTYFNPVRLDLLPGERVLVPTGLIFDIPSGYSVRLHIRSSVAAKLGLNLANSEGVIDSDYVDPIFILLQNNSISSVEINHGERLAQAELVPLLKYELIQTEEKPGQKGDRVGGFGSTGK
jgi:dUTP pyrophosphatase